MSVFEAIGIKPTFWPPNSLDLNPIQTIWDETKDYINKKYSEVHRSYKRLREVVIQAWESIILERIRELIREMPERCKAVIDAQGMYIKYQRIYKSSLAKHFRYMGDTYGQKRSDCCALYEVAI